MACAAASVTAQSNLSVQPDSLREIKVLGELEVNDSNDLGETNGLGETNALGDTNSLGETKSLNIENAPGELANLAGPNAFHELDFADLNIENAENENDEEIIEDMGGLVGMNRQPIWVFVRTLGEGAFGEVKLVVDRTNPTFAVAVKCVDLIRHPDAVASVKKEALLQRMLFGHPNVLQYIGMKMQTRREFQIFVEYVDGGELYDRIEPDVGMSPMRAQYYFRQLIAGVEFMHSKGVAHRDIKPENLLLTQGDVLKISDFGLATVFRKDDVERFLCTRCGTMPYVAPQVISGIYRGEPSDIWSCGIVLVTMLAGEFPWDKPELENPNYHIWAEGPYYEIYPWKKVDNVALGLLRKILCADEEERLTIERIKKHPWYRTDFTNGKVLENDLDLVEKKIETTVSHKENFEGFDFSLLSCSDIGNGEVSFSQLSQCSFRSESSFGEFFDSSDKEELSRDLSNMNEISRCSSNFGTTANIESDNSNLTFGRTSDDESDDDSDNLTEESNQGNRICDRHVQDSIFNDSNDENSNQEELNYVDSSERLYGAPRKRRRCSNNGFEEIFW